MMPFHPFIHHSLHSSFIHMLEPELTGVCDRGDIRMGIRGII